MSSRVSSNSEAFASESWRHVSSVRQSRAQHAKNPITQQCVNRRENVNGCEELNSFISLSLTHFSCYNQDLLRGHNRLEDLAGRGLSFMTVPDIFMCLEEWFLLQESRESEFSYFNRNSGFLTFARPCFCLFFIYNKGFSPKNMIFRLFFIGLMPCLGRGYMFQDQAHSI